tara:strand:+ start:229 stop:435 length:207 start_codon:yes stop_codon:yes gene_type:complete
MKKSTEIILEISGELSKLKEREEKIREKINILWLTDAIVTGSLKYDTLNEDVSASEFRKSCEESKKED